MLTRSCLLNPAGGGTTTDYHAVGTSCNRLGALACGVAPARHVSHEFASTSCASATRVVRSHRHSLMPPCRVTNTSQEIYRAVGKPLPDGETDAEVYVNQTQVHNPQLGRLEQRVGKFYLEELFNDSGVDLEETAYWFHTPPGGWNTEPLAMPAAQDAPVTFPQPWHEDAEEQGRKPLDQLREGEVMEGMITDCWLYHGIQIDLGAEFDGLVPIMEAEWMQPGVREALMPDTIVKVRVHKIRRPGLYRWPVQLELLDPVDVAGGICAPQDWEAPIDHEWCTEQGWQIQDICAATGRTYEPASYFVPGDEAEEMLAMEAAYGYDDEESNRPRGEYLQEEYVNIHEPRILNLMTDLMTTGP